MTQFDPNEFAFMGLDHPVRAESAIEAVEVEGHLPPELNGAYYRVGPDPTYPPFHKNFAPVVDGNGMMVMFRFRDGQVDFRSKYVETERFQLERAANKALFGAYRNPYSDDPTVAGAVRGTANTTMYEHAGILFALKEDSLGVSVEQVSLNTLGVHDFGGAVTSATMTAHPKTDPHTGEMIFYGSAAKGETTADIALYVADASGKIVKEEWVEAPYASMVHDFAVTENWIVFPVMPTVSDLDRIKAGGPIYNWEPERGMYLGLMPRSGTAADVRWIRSDARWFYHVMNAHEDASGRLLIDLAEMGAQPFPWFHVDPGKTWNPMATLPTLTRWTVDPTTGAFTTAALAELPAEMPRIDPRHELHAYRHGFLTVDDPAQPPRGMPGPGPMNSLGHIDHLTGQMELAYAGEQAVFEEPQFIPRSPDAPEGDGFLLAIRHTYDTLLSELAVLDTADLAAGPVAVVKLPFRVRPGVHGTWVQE